MQTTWRTLTDQQAHTLDHLVRYELTEPRVLKKIEHGATRMMITKRIGRLCRRGLIERHYLDANRVYYRLGAKARSYFDVPERLLGPMGPQTFGLAQAVLHYCCLGPRRIERLKPEELAAALPGLPQAEQLQPYYVDPQGYLGLFRLVDPRTPIHRVVTATRESLQKKWSLCEATSQLIRQEKFLVVLMTYTDGQRDKLKRGWGTSSVCQLSEDGPSIPIRVHTIPGGM